MAILLEKTRYRIGGIPLPKKFCLYKGRKALGVIEEIEWIREQPLAFKIDYLKMTLICTYKQANTFFDLHYTNCKRKFTIRFQLRQRKKFRYKTSGIVDSCVTGLNKKYCRVQVSFFIEKDLTKD